MSNDPFSTASGSRAAIVDPHQLRVGQRLAGIYTLRRSLPSSVGRPPIWIAEDDLAGKEVSLHFLPSEVAESEDLREVLRMEVRRSRQMIHPHILRVHELAEDANWAAVVMDAYEGESIARQLQQRPKGFFETFHIQPWLTTLLQTLSDAHGIGLHHRNLNPADLIITSDGNLLVANFGIARSIADALHKAGVRDDRVLAYTSPQVLAGGLGTASDDVYSVGATLFELLTGHVLFEGGGTPDKIRSETPIGVSEGRKKWRLTGDEIPQSWDRTIARCLSKAVADRPTSAVNVAECLAALEEKPAAKAPAAKAEAAPARRPASQRPAAPGPAPKPGPVPAEPEHFGVAGEDLDSEPLDTEARETVAPAGARRPLLSSPTTSLERSRKSNQKALLVVLLACAAAAGVWIAGSLLRFPKDQPLVEGEPQQKEETPEQPEKEKAPVSKFLPPSAPGTPPELTALRPGLPIRPKPGADPSAMPDSVAPVDVEPAPQSPAKPVNAPESQTTAEALKNARNELAELKTQLKAQPAPKAVETPVQSGKTLVEEPAAAAARSLEQARRAAEIAKRDALELEIARKERETQQMAAALLASQAREAAEQKAREAEAAAKALNKFDEENKAKRAVIAAAEAKLREAQQQLALAKGEEPKPGAAPAPAPAPVPAVPGESSIGLRFVPVGNVQFSVYKTRVKDFALFVEQTGYPKTRWKNPGFDQTPDDPVVMVSWNDAMAFCKWLTDRDHKEGRIAATEYYRLPTDLEWSQAVGLENENGASPELRDMGVADVYPWGTQWPPPSGAGNYTGQETGSDVAIPNFNDGYQFTSPVGSFKPNALGLYDMGGNAWEWCMDTWNSKARSRVLRGGSWFQGALQLSLLSSCRLHSMPDREKDHYGFRVVRAQTTDAPSPAKDKERKRKEQ